MRVVAIKSFVGKLPDGQTFRAVEGDEFELPEGVDWLRAGLVTPVTKRGAGPETASVKPPENAMQPPPEPKSKRSK